MKKVFRIFTIAAIAFGMSMTVACTDDNEGGGNNNGNGGNGGNTENLPTTIDENFDNGISNWTVIDADSDGDSWIISTDVLGEGYGHNGSTGCALSKSYDNNIGVLYPDNYLVSKKIYINDGAKLTWFVAAQDASYPEEHYSVEIGTVQNGTFNKIATIFEETLTAKKAQSSWYNREVNLSQYKGQSVQIAFRHHNCSDMYFLLVDDVKVQ